MTKKKKNILNIIRWSIKWTNETNKTYGKDASKYRKWSLKDDDFLKELMKQFDNYMKNYNT